MKKIIIFLSTVVSIIGCSKQDYFEIPTNADGSVYLTTISTTVSTGISSLDDAFTVTATLPNAKAGDVMNVELLQLQIPESGGTTKQLLPMAGTLKTVTVGSDLKASVSYSRTDAKLVNVGDYVTVIFSGKTDYAKQRVDLVPASSATKPKVGDKEIDVARTSETAYFNVSVAPKAESFSGTLIAKRKNGKNDAWVTIPGPFTGTQPFKIPISGTDFAAGKDTMFYAFSATSGSFTDEITTSVIVRDPYFYLKKSTTLTLGGASAGNNLLINAGVAETDSKAIIAVSGSLILKGGPTWLAAGNSISFVPSSLATYEANNSVKIVAEFNAGTPATTADPLSGNGIYIYKIVNGPAASDVYYGMVKITNAIPNTSVAFEYRIGDQYAHLSVIK